VFWVLIYVSTIIMSCVWARKKREMRMEVESLSSFVLQPHITHTEASIYTSYHKQQTVLVFSGSFEERLLILFVL